MKKCKNLIKKNKNKSRRISFACVTILFLLSVSCGSSRPHVDSREKTAPIVGVWNLVSPEWPGGGEIKKIITKEHFVVLLTSDNIVISSFGGTYSLDGETCTESIEFGSSNRSQNIGTKSIVKVNVKGNVMNVTWQMSGRDVNEVWVRVE